jgi:pyruvate kinase
VAVSPSEAVLRKLALVWGVIPVQMTQVDAGGDRLATAVKDAFDAGTLKPGERAVVLGGHPIEGGPRFPTIRVVRVGENGESGDPG